MKRLILTAFWTSLLLVGCSKSPAPKGPETFDRYIFFSQQVESKASLINYATDLAGQTFGVLGYHYDATTNWDKYSNTTPALTPNVFYDEFGNLVTLQTLTCDASGTSASYAPLQGWHSNQKYTFFACYPMPAVNTSVYRVDSENSILPVIQYSMNPATAEDFEESMLDVMVATPLKDVYWKSNQAGGYSGANGDGEVTFTFQHCLSSLGVRMKNSTARNVQVKNVTLTITNIQSHTIQLALDGSVVNTDGSLAGPQSLAETEFAFSMLAATQTLAPPSGNNLTYQELDNKLILIPQNSDLNISLSVTYTREAVDGHAAYEGTLEVSDIKTKLEAGKKHLLSLNFTESIVEVEVSKDGWKVVDTVDNTFN